MNNVHIGRAAFPILPSVPTEEDVQYTHNYSASNKYSFYSMEDAIADFRNVGWFDMNSVSVLEANNTSLTEWTVSSVSVSTSNYTTHSTTTPPDLTDERYIEAYILSALNYDGTTVSYGYSRAGNYVPDRAISLLRIEGITEYDYIKTYQPSTSNRESLSAYRSPTSDVPEYTRCKIGAYRTSWLVEVWTQISGAWYMSTDTVELISTVPATRYFSKAALLNAWNKQGSKSKDDITETESS